MFHSNLKKTRWRRRSTQGGICFCFCVGSCFLCCATHHVRVRSTCAGQSEPHGVLGEERQQHGGCTGVFMFSTALFFPLAILYPLFAGRFGQNCTPRTVHLQIDHLQIDQLLIDHLDPNLPLLYVVQDLYGTYPTVKPRPTRSCRRRLPPGNMS